MGPSGGDRSGGTGSTLGMARRRRSQSRPSRRTAERKAPGFRSATSGDRILVAVGTVTRNERHPPRSMSEQAVADEQTRRIGASADLRGRDSARLAADAMVMT